MELILLTNILLAIFEKDPFTVKHVLYILSGYVCRERS